ncbi:MAG: MATE family efflux transporter [Erysipelotrichaceae bacterium]|nr:MATE family efflux transporter [Erysipelotrichaceae bacterium]
MEKNGQYLKMTSKPIPALIVGLSIPTILSMLVTNIYNMVDTAFVGVFGNAASGAVGVVFGYMSILQAFGFMCGQGSGSIMSRKLGAKDLEGASRYSSTGFFFSFAIGLIIAIISWFMLDPLVYLLGSTDTIAPYAKTYISYIIIAAPFLTSSLTLNNLLRYEGRAKLGTVGLLTGSILNIFGDILFMFKMNMGIAGAGLSTCLSQIVSFILLISMFLLKKTQTTISIRHVDRLPRSYINIATTGFPSLLRQSLASISTMILNSCANVYGDEAVAAMSVVSRISFFVMSVAIGMGQGFQPVSAFNYGAKIYSRVKKAFFFTLVLSEVLLVAIMIPVYLKAPFLVELFRNDPLVISYATRALRLQCLTMVFVPITMMVEMGFQSTGQKVLAAISSSLRSGVLFIPTLLILSKIRGLYGIEEAQPVAYLLSLPICLYFTKIFLSNLPEDGMDIR